MEEKILFEFLLFRDGKPDNIPEIDDIDFVINTLINLSNFRPQKYDLVFEFHKKYSERKGFREQFLEKALKQKSFFVNLLFEKNIYTSQDVENLYGPCSEVKDLIALSNKISHLDLPDNDFSQNAVDPNDSIIQTNYSPGTIEYCLKHDDINEIRRIYSDPSFFQVKVYPIEINNITNLDFSLLGFCGFFGSINCFKFYLETKNFTIDQSVIECVVCGGSIDIFHLCLQAVDVSGFTSKLLFLASCYNNLDILRFLHENGAELNQEENGKITPLHKAAQYGHLCVVEYLVNHKADINAKNKDAWTPLHLASDNDHLSVVEFLVNQKADANAIANGYPYGTPLHFAAINDYLSIVEYLVNQKVDINAKDKYFQFYFLMRLLSIVLLEKVILMLLNI